MEIDTIVSKQIINYLKDFFYKKRYKTIKKKHKTNNKLKKKTLKR
jgi:hypothetical protein